MGREKPRSEEYAEEEWMPHAAQPLGKEEEDEEEEEDEKEEDEGEGDG